MEIKLGKWYKHRNFASQYSMLIHYNEESNRYYTYTLINRGSHFEPAAYTFDDEYLERAFMPVSASDNSEYNVELIRLIFEDNFAIKEMAGMLRSISTRTKSP